MYKHEVYDEYKGSISGWLGNNIFRYFMEKLTDDSKRYYSHFYHNGNNWEYGVVDKLLDSCPSIWASGYSLGLSDHINEEMDKLEETKGFHTLTKHQIRQEVILSSFMDNFEKIRKIKRFTKYGK